MQGTEENAQSAPGFALAGQPKGLSLRGPVRFGLIFAELLRGIVKTIDRLGLKSLFLRKHLVDVARFYRQLPKTGEVSAATLKWNGRLQRERDKLFTFLKHDGVTWNNNNAEHAIKAFARLRRAIEGLSNPKGIEEYLILLSVWQTCKYSGLDFLAFLRSGETDIGAFAAENVANVPRQSRHH